jgi:hypothetical protein
MPVAREVTRRGKLRCAESVARCGVVLWGLVSRVGVFFWCGPTYPWSIRSERDDMDGLDRVITGQTGLSAGGALCGRSLIDVGGEIWGCMDPGVKVPFNT